MTLDAVKLPTFRQAQTAMLMSAEGIVRSHKPKGEQWTDLAEIAVDIKPNFGKIGAETMGLLSEANVHAV